MAELTRLSPKYEHAKKDIDSLKILIDKHHNLQKLDPILPLVTREALIKRFEYSIDTLWKYTKLYLKEKHGIEQKSPKTVFKECLRLGLISEAETELSLEMVDDRNLTSHTYNEDLAQEIANDIPKYYLLMDTIITKLSS